MRLSNRKTKQQFIVEKGINQFVLFNPVASTKKNLETDFNELVDQFILDLPKRLPKELDADRRKKIIAQIKNAIKQNRSEIEKLLADRRLIEELTRNHQQTIKNQRSDPSFLQMIASLLFSSAFPKVSLILSLLPAWSFAQNNLVIHQGIPTNGLSLCLLCVSGCLQGYLTNGTQPWELGLPQFDRGIQITSQPVDQAAYNQLNSCLSLEKVGNMVADAYSRGGTITETCNYQSTIWKDCKLSGQATSIPIEQCATLQSNFTAASEQCMQLPSQSGAMSVGSIVGLSVGLCLALFACCYCKKKMSECKGGPRYTQVSL